MADARVIELYPAELEQERCSGCLTWQMKLALTLREDCFPTALLCAECEEKLDAEDRYDDERCPLHTSGCAC